MKKEGIGQLRLDIVSRFRSEIYGAAAAWIVLFHFTVIWHLPDLLPIPLPVAVVKFLALGNVGVDIFLFLSGISLYFSLEKGSTYGGFIAKRLRRLVPSVWLVVGPLWFITLMLRTFRPGAFLARMSLLDFWVEGNKGGFWYVSFIIILYLVYPAIHRYLFHSEGRTLKRCMVLCILPMVVSYLLWKFVPSYFAIVEIGLQRLPIFFVGCFLGRAVFEGRAIPRWNWAIAFGAASLFFWGVAGGISCPQWCSRFLYVFGGIGMSYCFALLFFGLSKAAPSINRLLAFVGSFSLELYVSHMAVAGYFSVASLPIDGHLKRSLLSLALSFVVAWAVSRLTGRIRGTSTNEKKAMARD
jgi:peptidoglycan/LPS O-acetylase OafA/YrhL